MINKKFNRLFIIIILQNCMIFILTISLLDLIILTREETSGIFILIILSMFLYDKITKIPRMKFLKFIRQQFCKYMVLF